MVSRIVTACRCEAPTDWTLRGKWLNHSWTWWGWGEVFNLLPWCFILLELRDCVSQIPGAMATVTSVINLLVLFAHSLNRILPAYIIIDVFLVCGSVLQNSVSFDLYIHSLINQCIFYPLNKQQTNLIFAKIRNNCNVAKDEMTIAMKGWV